MSGEFVIGVDVGTQGTKAVMCNCDGRCVAEAFCASIITEPEQGALVEDPEEQFGAVCTTIRQCIERSAANPRDIAAVAIDGQMAGILGVGADGRHVTPYDSWLDTRCASYIARMNESAGNAILASSGNVPSINHGPKILWWKHEHPATYRRVSAFVQPGAYAAMRLCGLTGDQAFIDVTYLHFSGFADNAGSRWNQQLCREFDVDSSKLPRIVRPEEIVGRVTAEAGHRSGLAEGTPVAAGCGDTAASFLACGAVTAGTCVDVAGTASVFSLTSDRFLPDIESRILGCSQAVMPGLWHHFAYINGGGMNLEWFRTLLATVEPGAVGALDFVALNELAENIDPHQNDPYFVPHMAGRVMPSAAHLRGGWVNLSWSHTVGHLYRSILEAVALEYSIYLEALRRLDPAVTIREVRITGGGENSRPWNRIKADIMQAPVVQITGSLGAPMGSAMLAACAAGIGGSIQELASAWVKTGQTVPPDAGKRSFYRKRTAQYKRFVDALSGVLPTAETKE